MNAPKQRMLNTDRLRSAAYDEAERQLEVIFHNGSSKTYRGVPAEVARRFFAAPNPAAFWEDRIAEEYPLTTGRAGGAADPAAQLDALFRKPDDAKESD